MILLSYDGSTDAQAAIERAAVLMPGAVVMGTHADRLAVPA